MIACRRKLLPPSPLLHFHSIRSPGRQASHHPRPSRAFFTRAHPRRRPPLAISAFPGGDTMGLSVRAAIAGSDDHNIPTSDTFIDPSLPSPDLESQVRGVCREAMEGWASLKDNQMDVSHVTGGITNLLLKVSVKVAGLECESVTVRIFGRNTDAVIDRKRELKAIRFLSDAGFGAKLLGVFQNGMLQSFIEGKTLSTDDMKSYKMAALIAKEVRRLHEVEIPGSKDAQLWTDLSRILDKASGLTFEDTAKQERYGTISFKHLREEIQALQETSDLLKAPIVFAHNDLLSGNLMYNDTEEKLYLIDFEYGSYNYRGYDIGNHFAEYAGFECDYNLYPDKEAQYHFFRHYLNPERPEEVTDAELEQLYVESNFFSLASHLYWAVWAIVQAKFSSIDFDYLDYFFRRFSEYKRQKNELLSLVTMYLANE